jgi:hypothetical protein
MHVVAVASMSPKINLLLSLNWQHMVGRGCSGHLSTKVLGSTPD